LFSARTKLDDTGQALSTSLAPCARLHPSFGNASSRFRYAGRIGFEGVSCPYRCDYLIEEAASDGSAALLSFTFELKQLELYLRPFSALIHRAIHDGVGRTVGTLKFLVEAEDDPPQRMMAPAATAIGKAGPVMQA
jgi:hypothetical protein